MASRHFVCRAEELRPGARVVRDLGGRSVGVFNVGGSFYALHNRCPHRGGALCLGPVTGTALPDAGVDAAPHDCVTTGTIATWSNGKVRVDYDLAAGTASFSYDGVKKISAFYAGVQLASYTTTWSQQKPPAADGNRLNGSTKVQLPPPSSDFVAYQFPARRISWSLFATVGSSTVAV